MTQDTTPADGYYNEADMEDTDLDLSFLDDDKDDDQPTGK
jgi:hypothetical protein